MRAEQYVSARRRGPLAVSTACYGRGARFAVAQGARSAAVKEPGCEIGRVIVARLGGHAEIGTEKRSP
jgi:hypothetical protein